MAHPYHHAVSSVRKWGGAPEDYLAIHAWFDESKKILADPRHRALRHHAEGIFLAERVFGVTLKLSTCARCGLLDGGADGPHSNEAFLVREDEAHEFAPKVIPVRWVGEQHVQEDLGWIPSAADWLRAIQPEPWMNRGVQRIQFTIGEEEGDARFARGEAGPDRALAG